MMDTSKIRIAGTGGTPASMKFTDEVTGNEIHNIISCRIDISVDEPITASIEVSPDALDLIARALYPDGEALITRQMIADWLMKREFVCTGDRRFAEQLRDEILAGMKQQ